MLSDMEADASPPPQPKPVRPARSPRRTLSSQGPIGSGSTTSQRLTDIGLDPVGEFARRRRSGEHQQQPRTNSAGATTGGISHSSTLPSMSSYASSKQDRRTSLPSTSGSSSSADSMSRQRKGSQAQGTRVSGNLRPRSSLVDPARSQRFFDQVNEHLSPPTSPEKNPPQARTRRASSQVNHHSSEESGGSYDQSPETSRSSNNSQRSSAASQRPRGQHSAAVSQRSSIDEEKSISEAELSHGSTTTSVARSTTTPSFPLDAGAGRRYATIGATSSRRRRQTLDAEDKPSRRPSSVELDQLAAAFPRRASPPNDSGSGGRGTKSSSSGNGSRARNRPSLPADFVERVAAKGADWTPSPRELGIRDRRERTASPASSPSMNNNINNYNSASSVSRRGSTRLRERFPGTDYAPPSPPPGAYPQHYTSSVKDLERERERKRSQYSNGSGGQRSNATSGSGSASAAGSRDDVWSQDQRYQYHRHTASAMARRSMSPDNTTVSSRYTSSRAQQRRNHSDRDPPGSAGWWEETEQLRARARTARPESRSQSRASTFADDDVSQEMSGDYSHADDYPSNRTPVNVNSAAGSIRRKLHPRAATALDGPMTNSNSAPQKLTSTTDIQPFSSTMRRSRTAMGFDRPNRIKPISPLRSLHSAAGREGAESVADYRRAETSSRMSTFPSSSSSANMQRRSPPKTKDNTHHRLLADAMSHYEHETDSSASPSPYRGDGDNDVEEHVRNMALLSQATTDLNSELRNLMVDLVESQVEDEMSFESSAGGGGNSFASTSTSEKLEKKLGRLVRNSDEQVRTLTEALLSLSRHEKDVAAAGSAMSPSTYNGNRRSIDSPPPSRASRFRSGLDEAGRSHSPALEGHDRTLTRTPGYTGGSLRRGAGSTRASRRSATDMDETPSSRPAANRRNKDSDGTVRPSPSFHYPRHSVASTSALSTDHAETGRSPTKNLRTRAISLDSDHYDYAEDRLAGDEEEDATMVLGPPPQRQLSPQVSRANVSAMAPASRANDAKAASVLRKGLNTFTRNSRRQAHD